MGKTAILFAGQGAQFVGMGKELYESNPAARAVYDMGEALCPGILKLCFEGPAESLNQTAHTQPALFLTDLACARALEAAGVKADMAAGFSLGEIPALAFTGVLSDEEAFKLVMLRGDAMQACAEAHPGAMAAVLKLPNEKVEELCGQFEQMWAVNYNCPGQLSCAGSCEEIDAFCDAVKAAGGRAVKLAVSGAFHTPYMRAATEALSEALSKVAPKAPTIPLYANYTAELYPTEPEAIRATIAEQASHSVRWESILRAMAASGADTFIEVGAGATLTKLVSRTLPEATALTVGDPVSLAHTLAAL
jgi:[acyl-carrier-protein] S-malonyltransferase